MHQIYLDYAAATPLDPRVLKVMEPYFTEKFYNPSALYLASKDVKQDVAGARQKVAQIIGAKPSEIIFTAGGTEANNIAISGVMEQFSDAEIITSAIEHESVIEPASKYISRQIKPDDKGIVDPADIAKAISDKTVLVSVMLVNNELGTIQHLKDIAGVVEAERKARQKSGKKLPIFLHTDAAQAPVYLPVLVNKLGVDLMTLNGGKIYGPKQSGILYVKTGVILKHVIGGGGQERGIRSGTENVPAIMGFAKALDLVQAERTQTYKKMAELQNHFFKLLKQKMPDVVINGSKKHRSPNNVHITIPGCDNERVMMELDEKGIMCATGSACSASNDEPSHVLSAIGLIDSDARSSLRFTMGKQTTKADIDAVVDSLVSIRL